VTGAALLGDDEQRQAAVSLGAIGVGACQQHQHVGPGRERAPRLDAVDAPAIAVGPGRHPKTGHVRAEVGLAHGDRGHRLARSQPRQPLLLLRLRAAGEERPRQDLGPGDQAARDAERAARELLRRDGHRQILGLPGGGEAPPYSSVGANELGGAVQCPRVEPPLGLAPERLRRDVVHDIADERAGDTSLGLAPKPVLQDGA